MDNQDVRSEDQKDKKDLKVSKDFIVYNKPKAATKINIGSWKFRDEEGRNAPSSQELLFLLGIYIKPQFEHSFFPSFNIKILILGDRDGENPATSNHWTGTKRKYKVQG